MFIPPEFECGGQNVAKRTLTWDCQPEASNEARSAGSAAVLLIAASSAANTYGLESFRRQGRSSIPTDSAQRAPNGWCVTPLDRQPISQRKVRR